MTFLPMALSGNEDENEPESNPMSQPLYFMSASAFLVSFTNPNKQSFKVKSVFKARSHVYNS